jgi:hypothetical protein
MNERRYHPKTPHSVDLDRLLAKRPPVPVFNERHGYLTLSLILAGLSGFIMGAVTVASLSVFFARHL